MTEKGNMRILTEAQHARLEDPMFLYSRVVDWNARLHGPVVRSPGGRAYTITARGHLARARSHDDDA